LRCYSAAPICLRRNRAQSRRSHVSIVFPPLPVLETAPPAAALRAAFAQPLAVAPIAALVGDAEVETVLRTGSTNSDLLGRVRARSPARAIVLAAVEQTAGRGRHGRAWHASAGSALLFSLAVPLAAARPVDSAITLACGLAAAEALGVVANVQLKWPNDLLLDGRKLGGVLCELALDGCGRRTLVAGFGINLWVDADLRDSIGQPVAALAEAAALETLLPQREALVGRIAAQTLAIVGEFDRHGFAPLRARFLARFALLGREVELLEQRSRIAGGVAVDIDAAGRLLLRTDAGTHAFAGGEVSLRPVARAA
jgi:BirA family biotin operon repressor/biotin-[acetyl-CoA-carboxylase] ligase